MKHAIGTPIFVAMIVCSIGCTESPQRQEQRSADASSKDKTSDSRISLEPRFYSSDDPEYERIDRLLDAANANVSLGRHQGINWYDQASKSWKKIDSIEELKPLLNAVPEKNLIEVSTGKAMWDKYDEYTDLISNYAKTSGYNTTVVTDAHSSGIIVSKVVHHNN